MTKYTVAVRGEGDIEARTTYDLDEALDWFTNACTEVMEKQGELTFASLTADGVMHGLINSDGIAPDGEVVRLKAA